MFGVCLQSIPFFAEVCRTLHLFFKLTQLIHSFPPSYSCAGDLLAASWLSPSPSFSFDALDPNLANNHLFSSPWRTTTISSTCNRVLILTVSLSQDCATYWSST